MHVSKQLIKFITMFLAAAMLLAAFNPLISGKVFALQNQALSSSMLASEGDLSGHVLSTGQFVYGPNVADFNLASYLQINAPHMAGYAESLYGRADYYSINPKVYLVLMEMAAGLVSDPNSPGLNDPFRLEGDYLAQVDHLSELLVNAYYLNLYTYASLPVEQRNLPALTSRDGVSIQIDPVVNPGTYAIMAGLTALFNADQLPPLLDTAQPEGFYQTYLRLFPGDDPLSEANHIYLPEEITASAAPNELLQLPFPVGESWKPNGVHDNSGGSDGSPLTDGASIDFSPTWPAWNTNTSNMWVVAAASGTPTQISSCSFRVTHSDGWATSYYHLENIQPFSGWINRNERIGVLADTYAEATCNGGYSTGPHLHFSLRHNGAFVSIDGTALSGWVIHAGRWNYDYNSSYFWLEKNGVRSYAFQPILSTAQLQYTRISSGGAHTCALADNGSLKCWGSNTQGQLGDGTTQNRSLPVNVSSLPGPVQKLALGRMHTCAITSNGSLVCWGDNDLGQLGNGGTSDRTTPAAVSSFTTTVSAVSAGDGHSCALTSAGAVRCWGDNSFGQLGNGSYASSLLPVNVNGLTSAVKAISTGSNHACAIDGNGAVKCWGNNNHGQLGNGSTVASNVPVQVSGLTSGVVAVSSRGEHTCALDSSGNLKCWGLNSSGQLGDGTKVDRNLPVSIPSAGSGLRLVSSGADFTCTLTSDRSVQCWGGNAHGQLGNDSTIDSLVPVVVSGLGGAVLQVSAGDTHACAISSDGGLRCWGANSSGQLGDGSLIDKDVPVAVLGLTYTLSLTKAGTGSGRVTSQPAGIDCNTNCSGSFPVGQSVTLTGVAASGSTFTGWSGGDCHGNQPCTVKMNAAKSVTATFTANAYTLNIVKSGSGTITSSPQGLNCGPVCSYSYPYNTSITLITAATPGSNFSSWGGACSGSGGCTVVLNGDKTVNANFVYDMNKLTVSRNGNGSVTSSPAGIDCGSNCTANFSYPTTVKLTAAAAAGSSFTGWSGYCSGTGVCSVPMTASRSVTANFASGGYTLSVSKSGEGAGSITSAPAGINCGSTCAYNYAEGTQVTLTAGAASNLDKFTGWSGACSGTGTCTVTMSAARSVSANFIRSAFNDVPFDYSETLGGVTYNLHEHIQVLLDQGLTVGTSTEPPLYSPTLELNRAMAAVFMLRGQLGSAYEPPLEPHDAFGLDDWSLNDWARSWAEGMYDKQLTAGCQAPGEPLLFCPEQTLPRVQAVIFGLHLKYDYYDAGGELVSYKPPPATGTIFADMTDVGYYGTAWAEQAYRDGLLPICGERDGKPLFCPDDPVNRAWAAYLIVQAKGLLLP